VAAAPAPPSPATAHLPRRAPHRQARTRRRYRASEYGDSRKNEVGNTARYRTVRRATRSSHSDAVRKYRKAMAPYAAACEMRKAAARGWPPRSGDRNRISSGYRGKNAALPSPSTYPSVAMRRNHSPSNRSHAVTRLCHPGVTSEAGHPWGPTELRISGRRPTAARARRDRPTRSPRNTHRQ
jgi:hypothetical protein